MKKRTRILIICTILAASLVVAASASTGTVTKELSYNDIKITLDGQEIVPRDANGNYVEPFIIEGTTYLPVRGIASALHLEVGWDQATKTVKLSSGSAPAPVAGNTIGSTQTLNGISVTLTAIRRNTGGDVFAPEAGNEYLIFEFDIANNTDEEVTISSLLSFNAYIDGYKAQINLSALVEDGGMQIDTSLASGRHILGIVPYEVPADWMEAEIRFQTSAFSSDELVFSATRDQVK